MMDSPEARVLALTVEDLWPFQFCSSDELREHAKMRIAQMVLRDAALATCPAPEEGKP